MALVHAVPGNTVTAVLSNPAFVDIPNLAFDPVVSDTPTAEVPAFASGPNFCRYPCFSETPNVALSLLLQARLLL